MENNNHKNKEEGNLDVEEVFRKLIQKEFEIRNDINHLQESCLSVPEIQSFHAEIKMKLEVQHNLIKEFKHKVEEEDNDNTKQQILQRLKIHQTEYNNLSRVTLRNAILKTKHNLEKKNEEERKSLFEGTEESFRILKERTRQDAVKVTKNLTEGLRRTRSTMSNEVERSLATIQELDASNKIINNTILQHKEYGSFVRSGRGLLTKLKRREFTDRLLIFFGVLLFLLVVLYIVKQRLKFRIFSWLMGE